MASLASDAIIKPRCLRFGVTAEAVAPNASLIETEAANDVFPARFEQHAIGSGMRTTGRAWLLPDLQFILPNGCAIPQRAAMTRGPGASRHAKVVLHGLGMAGLRFGCVRNDDETRAQSGGDHQKTGKNGKQSQARRGGTTGDTHKTA